jgi:hypothetical protein
MIFRRLTLLCAFAATLSLTACGEQLSDLKTAAVDIGAQAAKVATEVVDTQTACTLAGQNEAFCGCLQTELGAKIAPEHIDAIGTVIKNAVTGGGVQKAAEANPGLDQKTKDALIKCSVQGAVGAAEQEAGQEAGQ